MDRGRLFIVVFSGLFLIAGVGGTWPVWNQVQQGRASVNWPTVEGQITMSRDSRSSSNLAEVKYRYAVAHRSYETTRIAFVKPMFDSCSGRNKKLRESGAHQHVPQHVAFRVVPVGICVSVRSAPV